MPVIDRLALQETAEQFQISLVPAFAFSFSLYENCSICPASLFQKLADFLQVMGTTFLFNTEPAHIILVQKTDCLLNPLIHLCFPLSYGLLPDERILIGTGFQFCPIDKYRFF